jgi:hypothetical protein
MPDATILALTVLGDAGPLSELVRNSPVSSFVERSVADEPSTTWSWSLSSQVLKIFGVCGLTLDW